MISRRRRKRQKTVKLAVIILAALLLIAVGLILTKLFGGGPTLEDAMAEASPAATEQAAPAPTPSATAAPAPTPSVTAAPAPTASPSPLALLPPAPAGSRTPDYSFYWFTDVQHYSASYPETFYAMTGWMRDNIETYNVKYVFFTGDIVHSRGDEAQWRVADKAMERLDGRLPIFMIAGNHDVGTSSSNYGTYLTWFGPERFPDNPDPDNPGSDNLGVVREWFDGGKGRMDAVTIGTTKYLFIGFGWGVGSSGVKWVNKKLAEYPEHNAVLFFHDYMDTDGQLSSRGKGLYDKIVKENPNVFLVLCGHRYNCSLLTTDIEEDSTYLNRRTVYNVMMNYQAFENGGNGYLTLIRVYEKDKLITFDSYSPTLKKWYRFDPDHYLNKDKLSLPVRIFD